MRESTNHIPYYKKPKKIKQRHFLTSESDEEMITEMLDKHNCTFTDLVIKGLTKLNREEGGE